MKVRIAGPEDEEAVSVLAITSFMNAVAREYTPEGVETFRYFASVDGFEKRRREGFLTFVAENGGVLLGMAQLKMPNHLAMLFVRPGMQRQGIGRKLIEAVLVQAKSETLTVNSSPNSEDAYRKFGFIRESGEKTERGIRYIPMKLKPEGVNP